MDHQFWKRDAKRLDNPSLKSKYVNDVLQSPMISRPYVKTDFSTPIKINERLPENVRYSQSQMFKIPIKNPQNKPQIFKDTTIPAGKASNQQFAPMRSSSLSRLNVISSDRQVYEKQRRDTNIITHSPREYIDSIKIFPKIRFQNYDQNYWRRRSFIEGNAQRALENYHIDTFDLKRSLHEGIRLTSTQK